MKRVLILLFSIFIPLASTAANINDRTRRSIDSMMNAGLKAGYYPGASIAVGNKNGILYQSTYGYHDNSKNRRVTREDVYDVASVTKVVATTFAIMKLYDEGRISLEATVGSFINYYNRSEVGGLTIRELLTHTSGLPYFPAYSLLVSNSIEGEPLIRTRFDREKYPLQVDKNAYLCSTALCDPRFVSFEPVRNYRRAGESLYINPLVDSLVMAKIASSYDPAVYGKYRYSDTNFYILRQIIEKISGEPMDMYTRGLFDQIGMTSTGYNPLEWKDPANIIPTEYDYLLQRGQVHGYVHDDLAAASGNVEGNAGIFSNAEDLSRFCRMMLNKGVADGKRILSEKTINTFTASPLRSKKIHRGLGFDKRGEDSSLYDGYGHTGYTGTMIWMDDKEDLFMVFLSNRVSPSRLNNGLINSQLRMKLWELLKAS